MPSDDIVARLRGIEGGYNLRNLFHQAAHRETEWALGLTAERVFVRIYELEQIMRGEYEEDGK